MELLRKAKEELKAGYTCVLCSEKQTLTATARGVSPVLAFLDSGKDLSAFYAADKVVGKATAFLYVLLQVKAVYAPVMSRAALGVLEKAGIPATYDTLTEAILNHRQDGLCPMETATRDIASPEEALAAIRATLAKLRS